MYDFFYSDHKEWFFVDLFAAEEKEGSIAFHNISLPQPNLEPYTDGSNYWFSG